MGKNSKTGVVQLTMKTTIPMLLLLVAGCAEPVPATDDAGTLVQPSGPYTICAHDLTEDETQLASDLWGVEFGCDYPDAVVTITDAGQNEDGWNFAGYYSSGGAITIDPSVWETSPELVDIILAHEVGHALGHSHVDNPCDIMWPSLDGMDVECIRSAQ